MTCAVPAVGELTYSPLPDHAIVEQFALKLAHRRFPYVRSLASWYVGLSGPHCSRERDWGRWQRTSAAAAAVVRLCTSLTSGLPASRAVSHLRRLEPRAEAGCDAVADEDEAPRQLR